MLNKDYFQSEKQFLLLGLIVILSAYLLLSGKVKSQAFQKKSLKAACSNILQQERLLILCQT